MSGRNISKVPSVLIQVVAYALATAVAVVTWQQTPELSDLVRLAVADSAATMFIFLSSLLFNNSSMYDPYWSVKPAVIATGFAVLFGLDSTPAIVLLVLMHLYNLRLTSNFWRDWPGMVHEDWRYRNFREQFSKAYWLVSLSGIHFFPTLMVYLACLPLYAGMTVDFDLNWLGWLGAALTLAAVIIAYVADDQMRQFRKDPANKGKNMELGLWKYSRHPNYFGEILTWWGIYFIALNAGFEYWWTGAGALAITIMFATVSIPMMDKRSVERRPNFVEYMKRTRQLVPLPKM